MGRASLRRLSAASRVDPGQPEGVTAVRDSKTRGAVWLYVTMGLLPRRRRSRLTLPRRRVEDFGRTRADIAAQLSASPR